MSRARSARSRAGTGSADLHRRISALEEMALADLRAEWMRVLKTSPHLRLTADLLRRGIAFRLQEAASGGCGAGTLRKLASAAGRLKPKARAPAEMKAGTTLIREWHGRTHTVFVTAEGFDYEGRRYSSLTSIAREITGAAWSGPRFFGVRARPGSPASLPRDANG